MDIRSSDIAAISAEQATFRALVSVTDTHIAGHTNFRFSAFAAACRFRQVTFGGAARLRGIYEKDVLFDTCRFCGDAYFSGAEFKGFTAVQGGWFDRSALFDFARFERRARIEPESVKRRLVLAGANFHERSDVATLATVVDLQDTGFEAAVRLQLPSSVVVANGARFAEGSSLSGTPRQAAKKQSKAEGVHGEVSVASLRGADLAGLTLSHCDLTRCHLAGANGLDRLRLDEGYRLARSPGWPRWTPRQVLVEEHLWRARTHARNGWSAPPPWSAELVRLGIPQVPTTPLSPADIAGTYRALRKAQEDAKDAPGAGDLFYGEMEMRRKAARWFGPSSRAERPVLASYWLVAGYGLRASRALAALAVVIALGAAGFATYGFVDLNDPLGPQPSQQAGLSHRPIVRPAPRQLPRNPRDLGDALSHAAAWQFAVESALPLPTYSQPRLSREGRTIRIFLRILGPILLGLIVLCVRSRVKR